MAKEKEKKKAWKNSSASPKNIQIFERQVQAYELRKQGLGYREIGTELGVCGASAYKYVKQYINDYLQQETKDELRKLVNTQLTDIYKKSLTAVENGDPKMLAMSLKALESIRKLHGLDAPVKEQVQHSFSIKLDDSIDVNSMIAGGDLVDKDK